MLVFNNGYPNKQINHSGIQQLFSRLMHSNVALDPLLVKKHHYSLKEDSFCQNCQQDQYDTKLNDYLLYQLNHAFSDRVMTIRHPKIVDKEQYAIAYCAKKFKIYCCQNGTLHLERFGKKVPMVKEAFRLALEAHGEFHRDGYLMNVYLESKYPSIILYYIRDFLLQFPIFCPYCCNNSLTSNNLPQPKSLLWPALIPKASTSVSLQKQRAIDSKLIGCLDCSSSEGICQSDQYQQVYFICLFILEEAKYPRVIHNSEVVEVISTIKKMIMEMQIRRCQKGTPHIWYASPKINTHVSDYIYRTDNKEDMNKLKNWQRILMKRECQILGGIIHHWPEVKETMKWQQYSQYSYHLNFTAMKPLLSKFSWIYPFNVLASMKNIIAKCRSCNPEKKLQELERPKIIFNDEQMRNFKKKQDSVRQKFLLETRSYKLEAYNRNSNIDKEPAVTYEDQCNNDSSIPVKIPPQEYEPDDEKNQHTPEVKEMLKSFQMYPEVVAFFNNDLIWNQESGPPPELYQFEEELFTYDGTMFIKKYGYDRMRRVIVLITDKMRDMYQRYGDCVCVDYIPSLIKRRSPAGWHFTIGIYSGQDTNMQNIIFGICFLSEDLMIYHKKSLQYFFDGMNNVMPETLITSNQKAICQAVELLQSEHSCYKKMKHRVSWFYVVQYLKSLLVGQLDQEAMLQLYCRSIDEKNPLVFRQILKAMTSRMVERPVIEEFAKKSKKYCLSCLENPSFIGFTLSTSRVLSIYEMVEKNFAYQGRVAKFFYFVFRLQKELIEKSHQLKTDQNISLLLKTQEQFRQESNQSDKNQYFNSLYQVGHFLQQEAYKVLLQSYKTARLFLEAEENSKIQQNKGVSVSIIEYREDVEVKFRYILVYSVENDHWECPCNWIYLSGLPCHHLMKVIEMFGGSLLYYINERWVIEEQYYSVGVRNEAHVPKQEHKES